MSSCVLPVLERFKRGGGGNKSARYARRNHRDAAVATLTSSDQQDECSGSRRRNGRSSSVPPDPDRKAAKRRELQQRQQHNLPMRDSRGFTIAKSGPNENVTLRIRHDHPTLGFADAAYQRAHQTHRMNGEQYEMLRRQLEQPSREQNWFQREWTVEETEVERPQSRGVISLGLPETMRPAALFRWKSKELNNNEDERQKAMQPPGFDRIRPMPGEDHQPPPLPARQSRFCAGVKKADSFSSSGRGSDTASSSSEVASPQPPPALAAMSTASFVPPNRGRRPPPYLLPKTLSPCPPAKMHPFIPNLGLGVGAPPVVRTAERTTTAAAAANVRRGRK